MKITALIFLSIISFNLYANEPYIHCKSIWTKEGTLNGIARNFCSKLASRNENRYREFKIHKNWTLFTKSIEKGIEWKMISYNEIFLSQKLNLKKGSKFTIETNNFKINCTLNVIACKNISIIYSSSNKGLTVELPLFTSKIEKSKL